MPKNAGIERANAERERFRQEQELLRVTKWHRADTDALSPEQLLEYHRSLKADTMSRRPEWFR